MDKLNRMPTLFVGHGTPMNAIEDNEYTKSWKELGEQIIEKYAKPKGIIAISAHWFTHGSKTSLESEPKTVHDMYGFLNELYQLNYPAKGIPSIAKKIKEQIRPQVTLDSSWGIDHGVWSVLHHMFKKADIPVLMFSVDMDASPKTHFSIGEQLKKYREEGYILFASGNVVHNLRMVDFSSDKGYEWANDFDAYIKESIEKREFDKVINYKNQGMSAQYSVPMSDHFSPLLYTLGSADVSDQLQIFNDTCTMGALSMTGYLFE